MNYSGIEGRGCDNKREKWGKGTESDEHEESEEEGKGEERRIDD